MLFRSPLHALACCPRVLYGCEIKRKEGHTSAFGSLNREKDSIAAWRKLDNEMIKGVCCWFLILNRRWITVVEMWGRSPTRPCQYMMDLQHPDKCQIVLKNNMVNQNMEL